MQEKKKKKKWWHWALAILAGLAIILIVNGLSGGGSDSYIKTVQKIIPQGSDTTLQESYESYLLDCEWEKIVAEDNEIYVNVSGQMLYGEELVTLGIQYHVTEIEVDGKDYLKALPTAFMINDIPLSDIESGLILIDIFK